MVRTRSSPMVIVCSCVSFHPTPAGAPAFAAPDPDTPVFAARDEAAVAGSHFGTDRAAAAAQVLPAPDAGCFDLCREHQLDHGFLPLNASARRGRPDVRRDRPA